MTEVTVVIIACWTIGFLAVHILIWALRYTTQMFLSGLFLHAQLQDADARDAAMAASEEDPERALNFMILEACDWAEDMMEEVRGRRNAKRR